MKRTSLIAIVVVLVLSLLASCAPTPTATPAPKATVAGPQPTAVPTRPSPSKTFKIGLECPFTGPTARYGTEVKDAFIMAFDAINWTVGDYKIEYVTIDDESQPEKGVAAYEGAVVRDKIDIGFYNWHSSVSMALMDVSAKYKIPHFFGGGSAGTINEKYKSDPQKYSYWMGKLWPQPLVLADPYVVLVEEAIAKGVWKPKAKAVALLGEDSDWDRTYHKALRTALEKKGWTVVADEYFPIGTTEHYPMITKLKGLNPQPVLVITTCNVPSTDSLLKQIKETGLNTLNIADGLGWTGEWYQLTGDASDYVLDQIPQWTTDKARAFRDEFTKRWGITPSAAGGGLAFDATNFLIKVIKRAYEKYGALNSETMYKVGQEEMWTGQLTYTEGILMKEYKFVPETVPDLIVDQDHFIFPVIQYFGGEGKIIWPEAWKQADLQIPSWAQ